MEGEVRTVGNVSVASSPLEVVNSAEGNADDNALIALVIAGTKPLIGCRSCGKDEG